MCSLLRLNALYVCLLIVACEKSYCSVFSDVGIRVCCGIDVYAIIQCKQFFVSNSKKCNWCHVTYDSIVYDSTVWWVCANLASSFQSHPNSFFLLSQGELSLVDCWHLFHWCWLWRADDVWYLKHLFAKNPLFKKKKQSQGKQAPVEMTHPFPMIIATASSMWMQSHQAIFCQVPW